MNDDARWLAVSGARLVDGTGQDVRLEGFGLGGWMKMENFISGYPANESLMRAEVRRVIGEEGYRRFFDRYLHDFFTADDARLVASLGLNCLRVPFNYRHFEDDLEPFVLREEGFGWLDRVVELCAAEGIYTILDLHAAPGAQNQHWHSDNPTHRALLWEHRHFQDRTVHLWQAIADRYKDNPWVAGYNPLNEPGDPTGEHIGGLYDRLTVAIREVDPRHVLFLDGNRYSTDFSMFTEPTENTVYTAHDYSLAGITPGASYPGVARGEYVDRSVLEDVFRRRTEFMRTTGTPIWIGEFGPQYTGDPQIDATRLRLLADQLEIYAEHGAGWSLWTYKDIGLQGLLTVRPDSPYLTRVAPVLEQKARLAVDSWGGDDSRIRHLLAPIEELVEQELPDYDPFPPGSRRRVALLVRHILLAQAMVGRYAACFDGLSPAEAETLAGSFSFAQCDLRHGLADVLAHRGR